MQRHVRPHVGVATRAECNDFRARTQRGITPDIDIRIIGIDHGNAVTRQREDGVRMLGRNVGDAAHELLVLALRVVDDRDRRRGQRRKLAGLAAVVHSDLDDRDAMGVAQTKERERQPDRIVEVAARRVHRIAAEMGGERGRRHFLHRRLAVAADNDRKREREACAPRRGQPAERRKRVVDDDQVALQRRRARIGYERTGRTAFDRLGDVVVSVEALAGQRDEQIARLERAAVTGHPREHDVLPADLALHVARGRREIHHSVPHWASADSASAASENGCFSPATS